MYYTIIFLLFELTLIYADPLVGDSVIEVKNFEFPFIVSIGWKYHPGQEENVFCTGSLVARNYVLTAAHCLTDVSVDNLQVTVGSHDVRGGQKFDVFGKMTYYDWTRLTLNLQIFERNDIGIMKLVGEVDKNIKLADISSQWPDKLNGKTVTMAGYGMFKNGTVPRYLHTASKELMSYEECKMILRKLKHAPYMKVSRNILCTNSKLPVDMTNGDGGGPIFITKTTMFFYKTYTLIGVNSASVSDKENKYPEKPAIHMSVYHYQDFIKDVIKNGQHYFTTAV